MQARVVSLGAGTTPVQHNPCRTALTRPCADLRQNFVPECPSGVSSAVIDRLKALAWPWERLSPNAGAQTARAWPMEARRPRSAVKRRATVRRRRRTRFSRQWPPRELARQAQPASQASFSASMSFVIAARSGSDAMILRSLRRTPLPRNSLILAIASPRTKLPNSGRKRPSRRTSRVQKRFLTAIFFHRSRRAIFERRYAGSTEGFGRNEPDWPFATLAK